MPYLNCLIVPLRPPCSPSHAIPPTPQQSAFPPTTPPHMDFMNVLQTSTPLLLTTHPTHTYDLE
eukprot:751422-Hanusia_phi.AAC.4